MHEMNESTVPESSRGKKFTIIDSNDAVNNKIEKYPNLDFQ